MSKEAYERASEMLTGRLQWEQRNRSYYTMRRDGLPRVNRPFPTASNAHYPSIDLAINKQKPFWMGQLTSGDRLSNFTSLVQQVEALSDAAADYFNFEMWQRSDFMREIRTMIDAMLLHGRGIIKATIDPLNDYRLCFESIDPFFFLMPQPANMIPDADDFIHIRQMTVAEYKRLDARWNTDPSTIQRIRGQAEGNLEVYRQQKRLQEGINYSSNINTIILYEHWVKTGSGHSVETYSPQAPDIEIRKTHGNPYKFDDKPSCCFFGFQMEVVEKGWYSPRGLAEKLAPVEQYATKLWNEKADAMTFANRPLYTGDKEILNSANYRWQPGEYIPGNIRGVQQGVPPFNFDSEIGFANSIAEQLAQAPDFGIVQSGEKASDTGGKARTATENNRISQLQQAGTNDNAMMFREDLAKLYRHVWGMICQFKNRDFTYYASGQTKQLPEQVLHAKYLIAPDGSPDGWNKQARFQKAVAGMQTFMGNPNVDPEELTKDALTAYDARVAQKAFVPTGLKGANEYEAQAAEILLLTNNPPFPVQVQPQQDQASRIKCIIDWMHAAGKVGKPVEPGARQLVHQNLVQRIEILKQQNPQAAKEIEQMLQQLEQTPMQGGQPPQNGQPAPQPNENGTPATEGKTTDHISINYKDLQLPQQMQVVRQVGLDPAGMTEQKDVQEAEQLKKKP